MIVEFFRKIKGNYFCLSTKDENKKWKDYYFSREDLRKIPQFLKDHADKDIYWCPHGFKKAGSRKKDNAMLDSWAWADLDEADPEKIPLEPTIAIQSSPGRYVGLWKLDGTVTEELNKAITQFVGADPSGYDIGQVLRVPGTRNYKYKKTPKVTVLWDDGISYRIEKLTQRVGHLIGKKKKAGTSVHSAQGVMDKYTELLSTEVRKSLTNPKIFEDTDRSEVLWKIVNAMFEAGASEEETAALVEHTPWNKFQGKANSRDKLMADIKRCLSKREDDEEEVSNGEPARLIDRTQLPTYQGTIRGEVETDLKWFSEGRIPAEGFFWFDGDGGVGKSMLVQLICAHLCEGKPLPGSRPTDITGPLRVLYMDTENSRTSTVIPRMRLSGLTDKGEDRFYLYTPHADRFEGYNILDDNDFHLIRQSILEAKIDVVVLDVVSNFMDGKDVNENNSATAVAVCTRLNRLCSELGVVIMGIRHINKKSEGATGSRGMGSVRWRNAPRAVISVGFHPEERSQRLMTVTKSNESEVMNALIFEICSKRTISGKKKSYARFVGEADQTYEKEIFNIERAPSGGSLESAMAALKQILRSGAVSIEKVRVMMKKKNFTDKDVDEAVEELDLVITGTRTKYWQLPDTD